MKDAASLNVTLTKMCELHGIAMPRDGALAEQFQQAFPAASYSDEAGEWRMAWKKGTYKDSNSRLESFFSERGVSFTHVDKC